MIIIVALIGVLVGVTIAQPVVNSLVYRNARLVAIREQRALWAAMVEKMVKHCCKEINKIRVNQNRKINSDLYTISFEVYNDEQ